MWVRHQWYHSFKLVVGDMGCGMEGKIVETKGGYNTTKSDRQFCQQRLWRLSIDKVHKVTLDDITKILDHKIAIQRKRQTTKQD